MSLLSSFHDDADYAIIDAAAASLPLPHAYAIRHYHYAIFFFVAYAASAYCHTLRHAMLLPLFDAIRHYFRFAMLFYHGLHYAMLIIFAASLLLFSLLVAVFAYFAIDFHYAIAAAAYFHFFAAADAADTLCHAMLPMLMPCCLPCHCHVTRQLPCYVCCHATPLFSYAIDAALRL